MSLWTLIVSLHSIGCPTAIVGLVSTIIVLAVYGQIVAIAVGESPISERFKRLPFRADADAAPAIVFPADASWIGAASLHSSPDAIEAAWRFAKSCKAMFGSLAAKRFELQASARFGAAVSQPCSGRCAQITAIASTVPENRSPAILALRSADYRQPAEARAGCDADQIIFADRLSKTSARSGPWIHAQSITAGDLFVAAVANTQPRRFRSFAGRPSMPCDNQQIAEATPNEIVGSGAVAIGYRHADNVSDGILIVNGGEPANAR